MMCTYSNKHGKQIRIENGTSDAKVIAALGADLGDAVFCDHAGYRTEYTVERNRYRRERVLVLAAKDKYAIYPPPGGGNAATGNGDGSQPVKTQRSAQRKTVGTKRKIDHEAHQHPCNCRFISIGK